MRGHEREQHQTNEGRIQEWTTHLGNGSLLRTDVQVGVPVSFGRTLGHLKSGGEIGSSFSHDDHQIQSVVFDAAVLFDRVPVWWSVVSAAPGGGLSHGGAVMAQLPVPRCSLCRTLDEL